jgi:hypothetical protein
MRCRQFVLVVKLHHGGGRLKPQIFTGKPERHGIVGALELHMCVAMDLHARPGGKFGRHIGKRQQQRLFDIVETLARISDERDRPFRMVTGDFGNVTDDFRERDRADRKVGSALRMTSITRAESLWLRSRTRKMFQEWCELRTHWVVLDCSDEPLEYSDD